MRPAARPADTPPAGTAVEQQGEAKAAKAAKPPTLTALYNVLEALREGRALTVKEKTIHTQGLVGVLKDLHDELDSAVLQAYGWADLAQGEPGEARRRAELLTRLVALNAQRAAEEAEGTIRWLRPAFQNSQKSLSNKELPAQVQQGLDIDIIQENQSQIDSTTPRASPLSTGAQAWPTTLPEQVRAVALVLAGSANPLSLAALEARFKGRGPWKKGLPMLLQTLEAVGRAQRVEVGDELSWRA